MRGVEVVAIIADDGSFELVMVRLVVMKLFFELMLLVFFLREEGFNVIPFVINAKAVRREYPVESRFFIILFSK